MCNNNFVYKFNKLIKKQENCIKLVHNYKLSSLKIKKV